MRVSVSRNFSLKPKPTLFNPRKPVMVETVMIILPKKYLYYILSHPNAVKSLSVTQMHMVSKVLAQDIPWPTRRILAPPRGGTPMSGAAASLSTWPGSIVVGRSWQPRLPRRKAIQSEDKSVGKKCG